MQPTKTHRFLLIISGLIALAIGASILFTPDAFHAGYGVELGGDPSLRSEIRSPGGALSVLGGMMLIGAFVRSFTFTSTAIAAAVYLAYGLSRLVSIGLDGLPDSGLLSATAFELAIGSVCAFVLWRSVSRDRTASATPVAAPAPEAA